MAITTAGCATQPLSVIQSSVAELKACTVRTIGKSDYAAIASRPYPNENGATIAQLADESMPSPAEVQLLERRDSDLTNCRHYAQAEVIVVVPALIPSLEQFEAGLRDTTVQTVQGHLSWGEYARHVTEVWSAYKVQVATIVQNTTI
jgi:hypothetical protein